MTKPAESINYYDRNGKPLGTDLRKKVLAIQEKQSRETGDTDISVECVMLFLINTSNQILVCKRASNKAENHDLWDKTLGGHVQSGRTFDETVIDELGDELGIAPEIIGNNMNFLEGLKNTVDLTKKAVVSKVAEIHNYQSKRVTLDGDSWNKRMNVGLYVGVYDGEVVFKDGEVAASKLISLGDLEDEIQKKPEIYTDDILKLIKEHAVLNTVVAYSRKVIEILKGG